MPILPDPAAVFAAALSLHDACLERAEADSSLSLSESYQGMDSFMREVMWAAEMFETWACEHVAFEEVDDVWPYLLEHRFGSAVLATMDADCLAGFNADLCLRIALKLRLPLRAGGPWACGA